MHQQTLCTMVKVSQAFKVLSDREVCDRLEVDLRWQAAAGLHTGAESFHPRCSPASATACGCPRRPGRFRAHTRQRGWRGA
jgi:hypothetical protein